jgi:hypothetical protein
MLDNIIMSIPNISKDTFEGILGTLHQTQLSFKQKEGVIKVKWFNMLLVHCSNSNRLLIKNSVHKLHSTKFGIGQPDNSTDFTFSQFITTANFISETFKTEMNEIGIQGRFEFGINIEREGIRAYDIIERYMCYKSVQENPFVTIPPRNGKPKQRCCYLSDYRLKAYYKDHLYDLDAPSENDVLRYEVVTTQLRMLRKVTGLNMLTLKELCQVKFWERIGDYTLETYDKIQKIPLLVNGISLNELGVIDNHCSSIYYTDAKKVLKEYGLRQLREKQRGIYEKWDKADGNIHNIIRNKISEKIDFLISN